MSEKSETPSARLPMPVDAAQAHGLTAQTWRLITDVLFPTAKTPAAILMALDYCKARGMDVFRKPVHIVPMWNAALNREVETVWPSIQEIQTTASRTKAWAGMDSPKWGPDRTHTFCGRAKNADGQWEKVEATVTFPEWCEVTVYRIVAGKRCAFTEPVYWLEAYSRAGGKHSDVPTSMWIKRPRGQLHKCAKAASLRAAFPEECGDYAAEEMEGKMIDDPAAAPIIEGTATRIEEEPGETEPQAGQPEMIDPSQISENVKKKTEALVARARKSGAWQAALDWANQNYRGIELSYMMTELKKASQNGGAPSMPDGTPHAAFRQARESLGMTSRARRTA